MTTSKSNRPSFDPQLFHPDWLAEVQAHLVKALRLQSSDELPAVFQKQRAKPLARDIARQLVDHVGADKDIDRHRLQSTLGRYMKAFAYCRAVEREDYRYNIHDKPVERVSEEERVEARKLIEQHLAHRKRRKEQRDAAKWKASTKSK